jgi:hypothetical protein
MLYTHYNILFMLLAHGVMVAGGCIISSEWRRDVLRPAILTAGAFLIGVLPWLIHNGGVILAYHGFYPDRVSPLELVQRTLLTYVVGQQPIDQVSYILAAAIAILALAGIVYAWFQNRIVAILLGLCVAGPLGIAFLMFLVRPMFEERYLIVLAPAYILLAAIGLSAIWGSNRVLGGLAVLAIAAASCYALSSYYPWVSKIRPDYRGLTHWVETIAQSNDLIVCTNSGVVNMLTYYQRKSIPVVLATNEIETADVVQRTLNEKPQGIWHIPASDGPSDSIAKDVLSHQAYATKPRWFTDAPVQYYAVGADLLPPKIINSVWSDRLRLESVASDTHLEPTEVLKVALNWEALGTIDFDCKVSLRLYNETGQLITNLDRLPVNGLMPTNTWTQGERVNDKYGIFLPAGTPPGDYQLALVIYDANTGKEFTAKLNDGTPQNKLDLGKVTITPITRQLPEDVLELDQEPHLIATDLVLSSHYISSPSVKAGEGVTASLLWRAPQKPVTNYSASLVLTDKDGKVIGESSQPVGGNHPTKDWIQSEAIRQYYFIPVSAAAKTDSYKLRLRLTEETGRALVLPGTTNGTIELETVSVIAPTRNFQLPSVPFQTKLRFGESVELIGYDLSPKPPRPGEPIVLTVYWKALSTADRSYSVFVHLLDKNQKILAQKDQVPLAGERPTNTWITDEYILDRYELKPDTNILSDNLSLRIGLYDASSGKRLPAFDESGKPLGDNVIIPGFGLKK